jgi:predicted dehydrogenase
MIPLVRLNRRRFLKTAAAYSGVMLVPRRVLGGPGVTPPSDVITRGVIGTGGMGMGHVTPFVEGETPATLAVCDVDSGHLAQALRKAGPSCKGYSDFRRLLERADMDTIHIATPPHWHALISIASLQTGRDVLCEKPMTHLIGEGPAVIGAVRRYGRMFQVNSYGRGGFVRFKKLVESGLLGRPLTVRVGPRTGDFLWKVGQWSGRTDLAPQPVPAELDYDMWLGPAPFKPYHPHRVHQSFRGYWDYDEGGLGDMGQHNIDPIQYLLGHDDTGPVAVEARAPWPQHPDAAGAWGQVTLTYANGDRIILESTEWGPLDPDPVFIEGPKGRVIHAQGERTDPPGLFERVRNLPDPPKLVDFETTVRTRNQDHTWRPTAEKAHRSITLIHLCSIAIRLGRPLKWDPVKQEFPGDPQANDFLLPPMRPPWHI